jgi:hypothetical protein
MKVRTFYTVTYEPIEIGAVGEIRTHGGFYTPD